MTTAPELKSSRNARQKLHMPRPLPAWLQVGVVVLLLAQGVQTAAHWYFASAAPSKTDLSRFEYVYQPDRLSSATPQERNAYDPYARYSGNMQPSFLRYAGYYAHAGSVQATSMRAYAPSLGRWTERDLLPAK